MSSRSLVVPGLEQQTVIIIKSYLIVQGSSKFKYVNDVYSTILQ